MILFENGLELNLWQKNISLIKSAPHVGVTIPIVSKQINSKYN